MDTKTTGLSLCAVASGSADVPGAFCSGLIYNMLPRDSNTISNHGVCTALLSIIVRGLCTNA